MLYALFLTVAALLSALLIGAFAVLGAALPTLGALVGSVSFAFLAFDAWAHALGLE